MATKIKTPSIRNASASSRSVIKTPQSLKEIEKFISESLPESENDSNFNDKRLQAYRTAFDAIMEELKTYRPVLAKIKEAYDANLSDAKMTRRELDETRQTLLLIKENCDAKLAQHKQGQIEQLIICQQEVEDLKLCIKEHENNKSWYQAQVDKLKIELSETYKQYRDERDARKILVSELRSQQADGDNDMKNISRSDEQQQDPVKLALALKVAREDLKRITEELFTTKADYGDVVPRREFENLNLNFEKQTLELNRLKGDYEKVHTEYETLIIVHEQIKNEREEYFNEADLLRKEATPRPNWMEMKNVWPDGKSNWDSLTENQTSSQKVHLIASKFEKSDTKTTLPIKGDSPEIQKHLRWAGNQKLPTELNTVHNRNFDRTELSNWLDLIWSKKIKTDGKGGVDFIPTSLDTVILNFFKEQFNDCLPIVYEYTYSLQYALENFNQEQYINTFYKILTGEYHESVKYRFDHIIATARKTIKEAANHTILNNDVIISCIKEAFPSKSQEDLDQIHDILEELERQNIQSDDEDADLEPSTSNTNQMNISEEDEDLADLGKFAILFSQDEYGRRSDFLKILTEQEIAAKNRYISEIENGLKGHEDISFTDAKLFLMSIDPMVGEKVHTYLTIGFGVNNFNEAKNYEGPIPVVKFIEGLRRGGVYRKEK